MGWRWRSGEWDQPCEKGASDTHPRSVLERQEPSSAVYGTPETTKELAARLQRMEDDVRGELKEVSAGNWGVPCDGVYARERSCSPLKAACSRVQGHARR